MNRSIYLRSAIFVSGLALLAVGAAYYLWYRPQAPYFVQYLLNWNWVQPAGFVESVTYSTDMYNWLPTFVHVLGLSLLSISVGRFCWQRGLLVVGFWVAVNDLFELAQLSVVPGVFDIQDLAASWVAGVIAILVVKSISRNNNPHTSDKRHRENLFSSRVNLAVVSVANVLIAGFGILSICGSYDYCGGSDGGSQNCSPYYDAEPVYMTYEELRTSAIYTEKNIPLTKTGKIYLYQNYLLVNMPNQGIHIYDNSDKQNPISLTFIHIPGNLDIAIKQDNLYVDSYIDLVVLDISNIESIREVYRIKDVFPYDPYQNVPREILLAPVDSTKGVVIGYKEIKHHESQ